MFSFTTSPFVIQKFHQNINCFINYYYADHSIYDLYNGSACLISLSFQGLEESTATDDYQMDSLCLYLWFSFWVACAWEGIAPFCNSTCLCCSTNPGGCKTLLFAVNRYIFFSLIIIMFYFSSDFSLQYENYMNKSLLFITYFFLPPLVILLQTRFIIDY